MTRHYVIPVLAVVVGVFGALNIARAQQPAPRTEPIPNVVLPPADSQTVKEPGHAAVPLVPEKAAKKPFCPLLAHLLHPHSWGCGSDPYNPGCSSCEDECIFLFGSCRQFYGEPCYKKAPPPGWFPSY